MQDNDAFKLPACHSCKFLDDVERHWKTCQLDNIYCSKVDEVFERRQKPFKCPFSPLVKGDIDGHQ